MVYAKKRALALAKAHSYKSGENILTRTFAVPSARCRQVGLTAYIQKEESLSNRSSLLIKVAMTYSPTNVCSTIGAVGLNFSVRNGKRWIPDAINRLNMCTVHLYNTLQEKEYESQTSENSFVEQFSLSKPHYSLSE